MRAPRRRVVCMAPAGLRQGGARLAPEASAKHGFADHTDETDVNLAWGRRWDRGSV
jgi:hypothetical protein